MTALLDPVTLMKLGGLKLRARRVVEGLLSGLHTSDIRGSSVEFAEYKEYTPGDEIRHIDWKAYGKSDKFYVKQFDEETNLRAYVLVDISGSMGFSSHEGPTKLEYAQILAASLVHLLLRQGDAASLVLFDDEIRHLLPPSSRTSTLDDVTVLLDAVAPSSKNTSLERVLLELAEQIRHRSVIILVSDMLVPADNLDQLLDVLRSRGMDVIVLHLLDPAELSLPYEGLSLFEGLENDGSLLVEPDDIRDQYQVALKEHLDTVERFCRNARADYHRALTDEPPARVLLHVLQGRLSRSMRLRSRGVR